MIHNKLIKLKKYLFLISILFFVLSISHLIYIFLYNDSKLLPIKGGTISEGLIGSFPTLNPLEPQSGNNKYVVNLLYRSLLKYNNDENKIDSDLASCDISNLLSIECYLKDNIFWSNGEAITADDVIATYDIIKTTGVNKVISSLLEETQIEKNENSITFKNQKEDINFLNIFFQPILSKETIDNLGTDTIFGNFPTHGQIYSGDFKISNISSDMTIGITKIYLDRNEFNNKGNISKLILNIFPNTNSLLQNKESINIFNDTDNILGETIPRLESYKYSLPQYVSIFLNQNKISNIDLRTHIVNKINRDNLIKLLGENNFKAVNNPYLTEEIIEKEAGNKNFEEIIESLGYKKKSKIIGSFLPSKDTTYSEEAEFKQEVQIEVDEENLSIDEFQEDSKYIIDPEYVDIYNFITKDDILLKGNAGKDIEEVYINDYKLANFNSGDTVFYYRLKESYNSIKEGVNTYNIYFVENGEKTLKETIYFIYSKYSLDEYEKDFIKELYIEKQKEEITKEETTEKVEVSKDDLEKLSNLNDKFYYNDNLESFSLNMFYISSEKELEETAYFIKNSLEEIGINIELFPISISDLSKILSEKDSYDILLSGINLGYFDYNIFPYFHSSQSKNGYNFSNIKRTSLDILLEDLKSDIKNEEEIAKVQTKILDILKEEQIIKTLYTPKINLLIDKNIKNISVAEKLINKSIRKNIYDTIYIKEEKIINFENKSIINFFKFLLEKINA